MIKLTLEYDGAGFCGWQSQPEQRTVQDELESALFRFTGVRIVPVAAGRTDSGVHALGQVASLMTESDYPADVFQRALNAFLPKDMAVVSAEEAALDFHARKSARGKCYRYLIIDRKHRAPLERGRVWHLPYPLDIAAIRQGARHLIGTHDFSSFRSSSCEAKSPVRNMRRIDIFRDGQGRLVIELIARSFLMQMARAIVGTLVETAGTRQRPDDIKAILDAKDRGRAGTTAPPHGLYLVRVDY